MLNQPQSVIYPTSDIVASRAYFASLLGIEPYFVAENYVGFSVNGYELGLFALADPEAGPMTYWGVDDITVAFSDLLSTGATEVEAIHDVGGGIKMANVRTPDGFPLGIIENPSFAPTDR